MRKIVCVLMLLAGCDDRNAVQRYTEIWNACVAACPPGTYNHTIAMTDGGSILCVCTPATAEKKP
jgi:hypothetical protein